jgi:hypothetical protein
VALEVGIVGLPSSGKSTLFHALTGARATGDVGMAAIPDPRLAQLAEVIRPRKVTPARSASSRCAAPGRSCSATCARSTRCSSCSTASPARACRDDLETLRSSCSSPIATTSSGAWSGAQAGEVGRLKLKQEVAELERVLAHVDAGGTLADWPASCRELEPLTTKPLLAVENGPAAST